jgi:hypothetical protein
VEAFVEVSLPARGGVGVLPVAGWALVGGGDVVRGSPDFDVGDQ